MKNLKTIVAAIVFTFLSSAAMANSDSKTETVNESKPLTTEQANQMMDRLEEIDEMDKSDLSFKEKRALKKEVKEIKRELKGNGLYISTGAAIIIILLLIILL